MNQNKGYFRLFFRSVVLEIEFASTVFYLIFFKPSFPPGEAYTGEGFCTQLPLSKQNFYAFIFLFVT